MYFNLCFPVLFPDPEQHRGPVDGVSPQIMSRHTGTLGASTVGAENPRERENYLLLKKRGFCGD